MTRSRVRIPPALPNLWGSSSVVERVNVSSLLVVVFVILQFAFSAMANAEGTTLWELKMQVKILLIRNLGWWRNQRISLVFLRLLVA